MPSVNTHPTPSARRGSLIMGRGGSMKRAAASAAGRAALFGVTSVSTLAIVFIFVFILKESLPFFENWGDVREFFTSTVWAPSKAEPHFGALAIFYGTAMVTLGACAIAVPLGVLAAVCLSDILPEGVRQVFKPVTELLAAVPSVAYGFFALMVLAPVLQDGGGAILAVVCVMTGAPLGVIFSIVCAELSASRVSSGRAASRRVFRAVLALMLCALAAGLAAAAAALYGTEISSGTNALNVSLILAVMALPTIVSISEDALSAVGRDMREGSLSLGATRAETIFKVVIPCAKSGIIVAVILGFMRVIGETMVVWMASGNSLKIPEPFYNFFEPVRTLTATIAGEMGEADQSTGSARYHVLFAMSLCLLVSSLALNGASEWIARRSPLSKKRK